MSYPTKANLTYKKLLTLLAIVIIALMVSTIYVAGQANSYQQSYQDAQKEIQSKNEDINRYTRPQLLLITSTFFENNNFTGIVFNEGRNTAHNARVSLSESGLTYEINLGDIEGQHSVRFSEYVSTNPGEILNMYYINILWSEKSYDQ